MLIKYCPEGQDVISGLCLLCRLLLSEPVLKWLPIVLFISRHTPDQTVLDKVLKFGM